MYDKDNEVGGNLSPRDYHLVEVHLMLRHQLRVHKWDKEYGYPHKRVEHIFTQFKSFYEFHNRQKYDILFNNTTLPKVI